MYSAFGTNNNNTGFGSSGFGSSNNSSTFGSGFGSSSGFGMF